MGEEGDQNGMASKVVKNDLGKYVDIEHLGILKLGEEVLDSEEMKMWKGAHEKNTIEEKGAHT